MLPKLMQWSKQQTSGANGNPTKIKNHTATLYTHASGRQEIYLFGGYDGRRNHNDIHVLDCSTLIWTTPEVHGEKPPGRNGHTTTLAGFALSKVVGLVEGLLPLTIYTCLMYLAALG